MARSLLQEATLADLYRQASGTAHPAFGDGSLVARLMPCKAASLCFADDPDFLSALKIAADAVLNHTAL